MHNTWNEWHKNYLISEGFEDAAIEIDLDELTKYCKMRGIKNNGKERSQFVQQNRKISGK